MCAVNELASKTSVTLPKKRHSSYCRSRQPTNENATPCCTYLLDAVHERREASREILVGSVSTVLHRIVKHTHGVPPAE